MATDQNQMQTPAPVENFHTGAQPQEKSVSEPLVTRENLMTQVADLGNSHQSGHAPGLPNVDFIYGPNEGQEPTINTNLDFAPGQAGDGPADRTAANQRIRSLIRGPQENDQADGANATSDRYLGSRDYRQRVRAQQELVQQGLSALPELARGQSHGDLEIARRSELATRYIMRQAPLADVLSLRDPARRAQLLDNGTSGPMTDAQRRQADARISAAADSAIGSRLGLPSWQSELNYRNPNKIDAGIPPTENTVRGYDRLATQAGREQVAARLQDLTRMAGSPHLTNAEREDVAAQIRELGRLSSPAHVQEMRTTSRMDLAQHLQSNVPNSDARVRDLMLEAQRLTPADKQKLVNINIVSMNLDNDANFMQRFEQQGGDVKAIREYRESLERSWREMMRGDK